MLIKRTLVASLRASALAKKTIVMPKRHNFHNCIANTPPLVRMPLQQKLLHALFIAIAMWGFPFYCLTHIRTWNGARAKAAAGEEEE